MPIITPADLSTHIYSEVINEITRTDETITLNAITAAVQETKMYLARFDLVQLFGTDTEPPTKKDACLDRLVKDIAYWHLIRLSNVSIDQQTHRKAYEDAIDMLKKISTEQIKPDAWAYASISDETPPDGSNISWSSQFKRNNYF